jgi:tryptophan-rich sensory protein
MTTIEYPSPSRTQQLIGLAGWMALCFATAAAGAVASVNAKSFYSALVQPGWAPSGWLFGPVWTTLFILMAMAAWLVWRAPAQPAARRWALGLFVVQLAANAFWSWLFFAWQKGGWAFAEVLVFWVLIALTCAAFWRIKPLAGLLLLPYLAWVAFAAYLNWVLWQANPTVLG